MKNKGQIILTVYLISFISIYCISEISKLKNQIGNIDNGELEARISELSEKADDLESKSGELEDEISSIDSRVDILEIYR